MKALILSLLLFSAMPVVSQEAAIRFEKDVQKFDKTPEGPVLEFTYGFTNTGTTPLIIRDIKVSCGCTKPSFPRYPIAPGATDTIFVSFDTNGKIGYQDRILEVFTNASDKPMKIRFKGVVDNKD